MAHRRRFVALLFTFLLGAGLLVPAQSAVAVGCPDPGQPLESAAPYPDDVTLGVGQTRVVTFAVEGYAGCLFPEEPPGVRILTPHQEFFVDLHPEAAPEPGYFRWSGSWTIDASVLVAADAGGWLASYELGGTRYDEDEFTVRRETRLTFNAGPEPVRHGTIRYSGRLTRADWERGRYRTYRGEELEILALDPVGGQQVPNVAIARPSKEGRYSVRQPFPGGNRYQARFVGDATAAPVDSRVDTVAAT